MDKVTFCAKHENSPSPYSALFVDVYGRLASDNLVEVSYTRENEMN